MEPVKLDKDSIKTRFYAIENCQIVQGLNMDKSQASEMADSASTGARLVARK